VVALLSLSLLRERPPSPPGELSFSSLSGVFYKEKKRSPPLVSFFSRLLSSAPPERILSIISIHGNIGRDLRRKKHFVTLFDGKTFHLWWKSMKTMEIWELCLKGDNVPPTLHYGDVNLVQSCSLTSINTLSSEHQLLACRLSSPLLGAHPPILLAQRSSTSTVSVLQSWKARHNAQSSTTALRWSVRLINNPFLKTGSLLLLGALLVTPYYTEPCWLNITNGCVFHLYNTFRHQAKQNEIGARHQVLKSAQHTYGTF